MIQDRHASPGLPGGDDPERSRYPSMENGAAGPACLALYGMPPGTVGGIQYGQEQSADRSVTSGLIEPCQGQPGPYVINYLHMQ